MFRESAARISLSERGRPGFPGFPPPGGYKRAGASIAIGTHNSRSDHAMADSSPFLVFPIGSTWILRDREVFTVIAHIRDPGAGYISECIKCKRASDGIIYTIAPGWSDSKPEWVRIYPKDDDDQGPSDHTTTTTDWEPSRDDVTDITDMSNAIGQWASRQSPDQPEAEFAQGLSDLKDACFRDWAIKNKARIIRDVRKRLRAELARIEEAD